MSVDPSHFGLSGFAFPVVEEGGTGASCDYPDPSDVREGVVYGDGDFVGTYGAFSPESGTEHSPANVLRWLLVAFSVLTDPSSREDWPGYCSQEPDRPDNCVTTFDTLGTQQGRHQIDGSIAERFGVMIKLRAIHHNAGWPKMATIKETLDRSVLRETITIGDSEYCVQSVRTGEIIDLGKEVGGSKRHLFTLNCTMLVRKID